MIVVLILHGVSDSADSFGAMEDSIVNYFLNKGFDVWMANNRGNKYSCTNSQISNTDPKFWDFSFQEMAEHDFPLFLQTVKVETGKDKITVMGHSQGGTQILAALAERPELYDSMGKIT